MVGRLVLLGLVVEALVEALTRPAAGDLDRYVVARAQAGQPDHLPGQAQDRRRFPHVEQEDPSPVGQGTGLQHEADGLGDGHEVPRHLLARDGDRPPVEDLAEERRHDAAAAAQHVAEPNCCARHVVVAADADHDVLSRPLGSAHHRAGVGGLVGRQVYEALAAVLGSGLGEPPRAQDVGFGRLPRVSLEDGHVLVGGRVEDNVGPGLLEQGDRPVAVAQVEQDGFGAGRQWPGRHVVEERLVAVEEQQATWLVAGHLAGDLAADRTTGAGHEHGDAAEVIADALGVHWRRLAAEEVAEVQIANVLEHPGSRAGARTEHLHLRPGTQRPVDDRLRVLPVGVRQGDEDAVDAMPATQLLELAGASQHLDAAQRSAMEQGVVVDEPNDVDVMAGLGVRQLVGERGARASGAHDEGLHGLGRAGSLPLEREQSGLEPHAPATDEDQQRRHRRGRQDGQGQGGGVVEHPQPPEADEQTGGDCDHDADRLLDGGVAPHRPVQSGRPVHDDLQDDRRPDDKKRAVHDIGRDVGLEARRQRQQPGGGDDADIDEDEAEILPPPGPAVHRGRQFVVDDFDTTRHGAVSHDAPSCFDLTPVMGEPIPMGFPVTLALPTGNTPACDNLAVSRAACRQNSDSSSDRHPPDAGVRCRYDRPHMARFRTLVAASWVVVAIGSVAVPTETAPAAIAQDAGGIDATGATDVTAQLQALFDRTPNAGVVRLARDGNYRVEGIIVLSDRHDLVIDGNSARIFATTTGEPGRNQLRFRGGSGIKIRNLEIQGANPHAGLDGYVPELEFQAAITIAGVTDVEIDRVNIHDTYGDLIFIDRRKEDDRDTVGVWIHDSTFARSGRQGIAVIDGRDIVIERNRFTDMARGTVDLEPLGELRVENVHIIDNHVGPGRLLFVPMAGGAPVNRVIIARNTLRGRVLSVSAKTPEGQRRRQFWVVDNTSDAPATGPPVEFFRVDGAVVHGNRQPITRQDKALVTTTDTCDVVVTNNNAAPGTRQLEGDNRDCGRSISLVPPEPPAVAGRGQKEEAAPPPTTPPTTAAPTTAAPSTMPTTQAPPRSSNAPVASTAPTLATLTAAAESPDDGVAMPVVVLGVVLLALIGVGGTLAFIGRRGRR
jgi:hypothetical protein